VWCLAIAPWLFLLFAHCRTAEILLLKRSITMMRIARCSDFGSKAFLIFMWLGLQACTAAIIGTNSPCESVTVARIAALPSAEQPAWKEYWERSQKQRLADQSFFQKEIKKEHLEKTTSPPEGKSSRGMPLNKPAAWYAGGEALRIAKIIVSYQTPAGGWSKNIDMSQHPRRPGERYAMGNTSHFFMAADFDKAPVGDWNYVGTFDNDATTTQLRFLGKVISAPGHAGEKQFSTSFLRGLEYIFAAQYPNGGWPQVWPLQGGYHDAITFNDNAMVDVLELLRAVGESDEFKFVPNKVRSRARASSERGIQCLLACQIKAGERRTVWCQQYDALTLQPTSARNYEMPSQASGESAGIMNFLMQLPDRDPQVSLSVSNAAAWFEKTRVVDVAFRTDGENGRRLVPAPGEGPIWARYYEIGTDRPIFGDRDKSIHDDVNEISKERRMGYRWFGDGPKRALDRYARWNKSP
jgi:PelA/Pel-15E family pectate lyase